MAANYRALDTLCVLVQKFIRASDEMVLHADVKPQQYRALLFLKALDVQSETANVGDVARYLMVRHHSAVGLIDRLEAKRLVRRERDNVDQRQVRIKLTEDGHSCIWRLALAHQDELTLLAPEFLDALNAVMYQDNGVLLQR